MRLWDVRSGSITAALKATVGLIMKDIRYAIVRKKGNEKEYDHSIEEEDFKNFGGISWG